MKRLSIATVLLLIMPISYANEIAGTRVEGQGAVCGEGQGKALEVNIALKKEFSYCIELPRLIPVVQPTPTPTPAPTVEPTPIINAGSASVEPEPVISSGSTSDTSTAVMEPTPDVTPISTPTPTPTLPSAPTMPEKSNVVIADVSAQTVTVREETELEWLERYLRMWIFFYDELARWWSNFNAE